MRGASELLILKEVAKEIDNCNHNCKDCILNHYCESIIECCQQQDMERAKGLVHELINDYDIKCNRECVEECQNCNFEYSCYMFY